MKSLKYGGKKKRKHPESDLCIALWQWYQWQFPKFKARYLRLEVGGQRTKISQAILKAEGNKAGTPDIFIALPSTLHSGLWLEVKVEKGKMTEKQKDFAVEMFRDYYCTTGYGIKQCKSVITSYMALCGQQLAYHQESLRKLD